MTPIEMLASAMGLGMLAGIRLYSTVLILGLGIRMGWFPLSPEMSHLRVLANTWVLVAAGAAFALEFLADKIPWVDSLWDSVHTVIRPVGAVLLSASAFGTSDPVVQTILALLAGGVALAGHSSKAATRLVVNHSPEPFTNIALSLAEDILAAAGTWLVVKHPYLTLTVVVGFLSVFLWLSVKIARLLRLETAALGAVLRKILVTGSMAGVASNSWKGTQFEPLAPILSRLMHVPGPDYAAYLLREHALGAGSPSIRCAATKSVTGLKNSIGYLCFGESEIVFVARRLFRFRSVTFAAPEVRETRFKRGLLLDRLTFSVGKSLQSFYLFKA